MITPGFMLVQGNHLDDLRELAVAWLQRYPLAPLENETILVQSNGIAQWLRLAVAGQDSSQPMDIAMALDIMLPARLQWQVYRAVLGDLPKESPFDKAPLCWRLLRILPTLQGRKEFAALTRFLENDKEGRKLYQLAERLADLFDQYQIYRADWLQDWAQGHDYLRSQRGNVPLAPDQQWQAALWRLIVADIPQALQATSRAAVHQIFVDAAKKLNPDSRPAGVPRRILVFGISSMPQQMLDVLAALSSCVQIVLCVHNPCRHYWGDIIEGRELFLQHYSRHQDSKKIVGKSAVELHALAQPLLASWGKQGRDYIRLLEQYDQPEKYQHLFHDKNLHIDIFSDELSADELLTKPLLTQLQQDILELRPLAERISLQARVSAQDQSLVFHSAHSAQREVEILHDQLLKAFSDDPELKPRNIMVMVPNIDVYSPHINAVFNQYAVDDKRYIPFSIADQKSRQQQPILRALENILNGDNSRFSISQIFDLLEVPALRAKFSITDEQMPTLKKWIEGANIRWGLNAEHRESLGLPANLVQNTWLFGLRRILLGYLVGQGHAWQDIHPYDEIGGLEAELIGPLLNFINKILQYWDVLQKSLTPMVWVESLRSLLNDFFAQQTDDDLLLVDKLKQALARWLVLCTEANYTEPLSIMIVREYWLSALDMPQLSKRFLAGKVNFATLMPMRAIPFQHIYMLGMNEGDFPRQQTNADFDLMRQKNQYRPGDRSRRDDDRYLFLEALLSAQKRLYISWVGRSIRKNNENPPSLLVAQLRDHIQAGWLASSGTQQDILKRLTVEHPMQPFSRHYFSANRPASLFSYSTLWHSIHAQQVETIADLKTFKIPQAQDKKELTFKELVNFLKSPVDYFYQNRLQSYMDNIDFSSQDQEVFVFDHLQEWAIKKAVLDAVLAEIDSHNMMEEDDRKTFIKQKILAEYQKGNFPFAPFNEVVADRLLQTLDANAGVYQKILSQYQHKYSPKLIRKEINGVVVQGWITGLLSFDKTESAIMAEPFSIENPQYYRLLAEPSALFSSNKVRWQHVIKYWVAHVFANAELGFTQTILVGDNDSTVILKPISVDQANTYLARLIFWHGEGLTRVLPIATRSCCALLQSKKLGKDDNNEFLKAYEQDEYPEIDRSYFLKKEWPDSSALLDHLEFNQISDELFSLLLTVRA